MNGLVYSANLPHKKKLVFYKFHVLMELCLLI